MREIGTLVCWATIELAGSIVCNEEESVVRSANGSFEAATTENYDITVEVSTLKLGNIAFVGFKQELDAQTEKEIQESSPFEHTLLISFLNGGGKYMPHDAAYDYNNGIGTYEVGRSILERGSAEKLVTLATDLLNNLK